MLRVLSPEIGAGRWELQGAQGCGRPQESPRRGLGGLESCPGSCEELQGCDAVLLELPALHSMVLIMCSLCFYKLQISINCFMEPL